MKNKLDEIRKRLERATPPPYETICREFSNHAPLEIWTEFGWADQLPRSYREPTYELFACAPTDIAMLLHLVDTYERALERYKNKAIPSFEGGGLATRDLRYIAAEALAKGKEIKGAKGE